jgi:hypothetical protein
MKTYWGSGGIASRSGRFNLKERAPGTHWIGGCVGPRAVLDMVVKRKIPSPRRESNPRTPIVQSVGQRYTDSYHEELYNLYISPNTIRYLKFRIMR